MDDARAEPFGDLDRAVGRAVVADHDLASDAAPSEGVERLGDADADRRFFIEAGDDCRHDGIGRGRARRIDIAGAAARQACLGPHQSPPPGPQSWRDDPPATHAIVLLNGGISKQM